MKTRIIPLLLILCLVLSQVTVSDISNTESSEKNAKLIDTSLNDEGYVKACSSKSSNNASNQVNDKSNRFTKEKHTIKKINKSSKGAQVDAEWNIQVINAQNVPQNNITGTKVKIALIDSGIDYTEDIDVVERKNFIPGQDDMSIIYEDLTGHGTAVAGILAAKDNADEISGINSNVEIYSAKVLDDTNTAPISRVVEAINWAIEK